MHASRKKLTSRHAAQDSRFTQEPEGADESEDRQLRCRPQDDLEKSRMCGLLMYSSIIISISHFSIERKGREGYKLGHTVKHIFFNTIASNQQGKKQMTKNPKEDQIRAETLIRIVHALLVSFIGGNERRLIHGG